MNRQRLEHLTVGLIGLFMLPVGLQAAFTPRSFFDDFPLGRGWIFKDSPTYNEHLIRDVGVLFLSLIIVTGWTILRRGSTRPLAVSYLIFHHQ